MQTIVAALLLLVLVGCGDPDGPSTKPPVPPDTVADLNCPLPVHTALGYRSPIYYAQYQKTSPDGTKLAFIVNESSLRVLDLRTGQQTIVDVAGHMPSNVRHLGVDTPEWCPYDNDRIVFQSIDFTDTVGDGKDYVYGQNLYIYSLANQSLEKINPPSFGKAGSSLFDLTGWLARSRPGFDSIYLGYMGIYIPENQTLVNSDYYRFARESRDGRHYVSYGASGDETGIYVDGIPVKTTDTIEYSTNASWSPDGKYIALMVASTDKPEEERFQEIWILDIDTYLRERPEYVPVQVINLQRRFCKYSFEGAWAEFMTDSTLAVSMHDDGDETSPLWEITTKGKLVRQLTQLP